MAMMSIIGNVGNRELMFFALLFLPLHDKLYKPLYVLGCYGIERFGSTTNTTFNY